METTVKVLDAPKHDARSQQMVKLRKPLRVLGECVLVQLVEETEEITAAGIVVVKPHQNPLTRRTEGLVLAVGSGKLLDDGTRAPLEVQVGERVLIQQGAGQDLSREGVFLKLIHAADIMAVL
jgi:chaperonin GroES